MIEQEIALTGSNKQRSWATRVIEQFHDRYPDTTLPSISDSDWWIKRRNASLEELRKDAQEVGVSTPFTSRYPRYSREDAINAVKALGDDYVVLDLETTGLSPKECEIVEIAMVHISGDTLLDTLVMPHDLVRLFKAVDKGTTKTDLDNLAQAPTFEEVAPTVRDIVTSYHIVIYNASFDAPFLAYQFLKCGLPVPAITATCAMRLATSYFNVSTNLSLEQVCRMLGIEQEEAHRARADVLVTIEVLKRIGGSHE